MSSNNPGTAETTGARPMTKEEQEQLFRDAMLALSALAGAVLFLKALAASITVYLALLPLAFLYGIQTCPPASSFDAKQQLRSVLRGDSLPPDHPDNPGQKTGFLQQLWADTKATLTSELVTLPGYEVTIASLAGAALLARVTMPTADLECVWLGCNHRWYYWGARSLSESNGPGAAVEGVSDNKVGNNVYKAPEHVDLKIGNANFRLDFGKGKQD